LDLWRNLPRSSHFNILFVLKKKGKTLYQLKIRSNKIKIKWEMVEIKSKIESENPPIIVDQKDGAILTTFSTTRLDSKKGKG